MGRKGAALLLGTEADAPASFPPPFLMLLPFSDPRLDFFHAPLLCLAEPNGSSSACRERSPEPAWSTQAAAERQIRLDEKRLSRSWDPTIQPGCASQAGKVTAQDSAGTSSWLEVPPARSCLTFVTSPATPEGWTESECAQRAEVSFMAV